MGTAASHAASRSGRRPARKRSRQGTRRTEIIDDSSTGAVEPGITFLTRAARASVPRWRRSDGQGMSRGVLKIGSFVKECDRRDDPERSRGAHQARLDRIASPDLDFCLRRHLWLKIRPIEIGSPRLRRISLWLNRKSKIRWRGRPLGRSSRGNPAASYCIRSDRDVETLGRPVGMKACRGLNSPEYSFPCSSFSSGRSTWRSPPCRRRSPARCARPPACVFRG